MAFTEASLNAQLDPAAGGRTITLVTFNPGAVNTTIYATGVLAPMQAAPAGSMFQIHKRLHKRQLLFKLHCHKGNNHARR